MIYTFPIVYFYDHALNVNFYTNNWKRRNGRVFFPIREFMTGNKLNIVKDCMQHYCALIFNIFEGEHFSVYFRDRSSF